MSMSVPHGFRFVTADLGEVHALMMAHRPVVRGLSLAAKTRFLARKATRFVDAEALGGTPCREPLARAFSTLVRRQDAIERGHPDPLVDYAFRVSVLPWQGRVYGAVHTWQGEWARDLVGRTWAEPFDYDDSCDQDEVPKEEYDARRTVWNELSRQDAGTRLSGCGFRVEFLPSSEPVAAEDVLAAAPTREERAWGLARDRVVEARMRDLLAAGRGDAMRAGIEAAIWFTDDEGREAAARERETLAPGLPEITLPVLLNGLGAGREDGVASRARRG